MENLPRAAMLAPELKIPGHPFPMTQAHKIKHYISQHYQNDPNNFNKAFNELNEMRDRMLQMNDEQEMICVLKRYFAQLSMMKNRFPMELDGEAAVDFAWIDQSCDMQMPIVIPDINFEICCVMYNIGCLHAAIAAAQPRSNGETTKIAFAHFQYAAWPFKYLRDQLHAQRCGLIDFDTRALTFYVNVMLAQGLEVMLEKALTEKRSPGTISCLALRIRQFYDSCGALIADKSFASDAMPSSRYKSWTQLCAIKGGIYGSIFYYARGRLFDEVKESDKKREFGIAVGYYKAGLDLINETMTIAGKDKREGLKQVVEYIKEVITQREQTARKENDFIYHERVPNLSDLKELEEKEKEEKDEPKDLVNAVAFDPMDPSIAGEDLFKELLPTAVIEIVSMYEEKKAELRRKVLNDCEKKDQELDTFLLKLQLNKLNLDQPGDIQRLPDELLTCYGEFSSQPNCINDLLEKFYELSTKQSNAERLLSDLWYQMRGVTNPRVTSDEGYQTFLKKLNEYSEAHQEGRKNNTELQKTLESLTEDLKMFSLSLPQLSNLICGNPIESVQSTEAKELRRLLDKVDEMKRQRLRLIADLRESLDRDEITAHALADPHVEHDSLIRNHITRHDKQVKLIEQNLAAQENVLSALTAANANFADRRKEIMDIVDKKNTKAVKLIHAFETFKNVRENAKEAQKFYNTLFRRLTQLQTVINIMIEATTRAR
ncbi:BRO1 domain-containing protein [Aphelenchoides besseyi]|nr:BRO1 domain-containing protein [Aphelenchoides besseyi]